MRIPIACPKCGNDFSAPESMVGRKARCPSCQAGVRVVDDGRGAGSDARPRSSRRNARGGANGFKVGFGIVIGIAVLLALAMAWEKLPQGNLVTNHSDGTGIPAPAPPPSASPTVEPPSETAIPTPTERPPTPDPVRPQKTTPKPAPKPDRARATAEFDTDRGQSLFANTKRLVLVRGGKVNKNQDPKSAVWNEAVANARRVIEKMGLEFSTGNPGPDAAVLTVTLQIQPSKKGTPGTKEITVSAVLTCTDLSAKSADLKYAKVWKAEQDLGTISAKSSKAGKLPNSLEEQMAKFFGKFRTAYHQAVLAEKTSVPQGPTKP